MSVNTIQAQIDSLKEHQKADEKKLRQTREDALRQAWLVHQHEQNNLPTKLSTLGANGGAVQSSVADITNEYQRNRRTSESDYANNLADSRLKYSDKFAQLQAQLADAQEAAARAAAASRGRYYGGGGGNQQTGGFKSWNPNWGKNNYVNPHGVMYSNADYYNAINNANQNRPAKAVNPYTDTSLYW